MNVLPDGQDPIDQKRVLRLVLGYLTSDQRQIVSVMQEVVVDGRGGPFASQALYGALITTLGDAWKENVSKELVVGKIQEQLLAASSEEGDGYAE